MMIDRAILRRIQLAIQEGLEQGGELLAGDGLKRISVGKPLDQSRGESCRRRWNVPAAQQLVDGTSDVRLGGTGRTRAAMVFLELGFGAGQDAIQPSGEGRLEVLACSLFTARHHLRPRAS